MAVSPATSVATVRPTGAASVATYQLPGQQTTTPAQASTAKGKTDSVTVSVAALQYQLGEIKSQIQQVSANCSLCDPTRVTVLAPLYAKEQILQSLISSANSSQ